MQRLFEYEYEGIKFYAKEKMPQGIRLYGGKAVYTKKFYPVSGALAKELQDRAKSKSTQPDDKSVPIPLDAENPRAAVKTKKDDYAYARESSFENQGEDIPLSARHLRNIWRGLEQAEEEGVAEQLVTRDSLLKNEPHNLLSKVNNETALTALAMYAALKKFPAAPESHSRPDGEILYVMYVDDLGRQRAATPRSVPPKAKDKREVTVGEVKKIGRKDYLEVYRQVVAKAEQLADSTKSPTEAIAELRAVVAAKIRELRDTNQYNATANLLIPFVNRTLTSSSRPTTVGSYVGHFMSLAKDKGITDASDLAEKVRDVIEGSSVNEVFDAKKKREGFNPSDLYVKIAERDGPKTGLDTQKKQTKYLMESVGLRGLQWGNSVTDDERGHHLEKVADAMKDLADVLDVPPELVSFHGRLGFSIGARGKGNALAHYEPSLQVINITRKSGVGSVAHEWGHFFDNILAELTTGTKNAYFSSSYFASDDQEMTQKMKALREALDKFRKRMRTSDAYSGLSEGRKTYWSSTEEVFARSFEKYVQHKLSENNRKNTYLSGVMEHPLWPSKEEAAEMAPAFDEFFKHFRQSKYMKKAALLCRVAALEKRVRYDV